MRPLGLHGFCGTSRVRFSSWVRLRTQYPPPGRVSRFLLISNHGLIALKHVHTTLYLCRVYSDLSQVKFEQSLNLNFDSNSPPLEIFSSKYTPGKNLQFCLHRLRTNLNDSKLTLKTLAVAM